MYFTPFCLLTVDETLSLLNSLSLAELRYCALSAQARWCPLRPSRGDCPFVALHSTDIHSFMQHNFLFPKVASPSQCASLRHDVRHCTCSLALLTFFFSDISGMQYAMAPCFAGREIYTKCCQYIHLPSDTKLLTRSTGCQLQSDEIPDSKITHQQLQVCALDTALPRNTGELGPTENSAQAKTRPHGEVGPAENSAPRRTRPPTTAENSAPTAESSAPTEIPDQVLVWSTWLYNIRTQHRCIHFHT